MFEIKKSHAMLSGIIIIVYAAVALITGSHAFWTVVFNLSLLAAGVGCLVSREQVKVAGFGFAALATAVNLILSVVNIVKSLIGGYFTIYVILGFLAAAIEVFGIVLLFMLVFMTWRKMENSLSEFWYAPAAIILVSSIIKILISLVMSIHYRYFTFGFCIETVISLVLEVILAVAIALIVKPTRDL